MTTKKPIAKQQPASKGGNIATTKKRSAKKRASPRGNNAAPNKFNYLTADLLKFLGVRRFMLAGDLPKKRAARQAIFAASLPPLVKFGLLHLVEYGDGEPGDPYPFNCPYSPEVDQALVENKALIKASVPRAKIQRMRGRASSWQDPRDPDLNEYILRVNIFEADLPPLSKLVLLALVECQGKDAKPLADYKNLPLSPSHQGAADRLPAEARLVAKLAKWTGLGVKEVVDALSSMHTQPCIIDMLPSDEDLIQNWVPDPDRAGKD